MSTPNIRAATVVVGRATRCVMGSVARCFMDQEPNERCICARIAKQVLEAATVDATPDPRDAVVAAAAKLERVLAELEIAMLPDDTVLTVCASFRDALRAALKGLG